MHQQNSPQDNRQFFFDVWNKVENNETLTPLENLIAQVIKQHPEYHKIFNQQEKYLHKQFGPQDGEENPFFHMGLHLSLIEQLQTDRPKGITEKFQNLATKYQDSHHAEHLIMEALAQTLYESLQRQSDSLDEAAYLERINKLLIK